MENVKGIVVCLPIIHKWIKYGKVEIVLKRGWMTRITLNAHR